ncbi:MAG: hypothetical protein WBW57_03980, partial [Candidatus Sulfotelmatobacter sp.]
ITRDAHDARRMRIVSTTKGTRLLQQGRRRRIEYLALNLECLNRDELRQIRCGVEILEKILCRWR